MAAALALGIQAIPPESPLGFHNQAYGDAVNLDTKLVGTSSAVQGDQNAEVTVQVQYQGSGSISFDSAVLQLDSPDNISVSGGATGDVTLSNGDSINITFYLNIGRYADTGSRDLSLTLKSDTDTVLSNHSLGIFRIYEKVGAPKDGTGKYVASLDFVQSISPEGGFSTGTDNALNIKIQNVGNTVVKNAVLSLTLPDGLSIYNSSNSANLGYISTGSSREVSFPITVDDDAASKNYAITAKLTGLNYSNEAVSEEKTFYVPVNGSGGSIKNAEITNISVPDQVNGEEPFTLSFDVNNRNSSALKNVKVNVEVPDGLLNKTRNAFVESSIPAGGSRNYSVKMFAADGAKEKVYTIKMTLSSGDSSDDKPAVTQYASVYVSGATGEKTPQLMVDNYSYGGTFVQAGDDFLLKLGLYNTSGSHTISNIKVTVSSEDGSIIPVDTSNSFYIDKLGKKERAEQSMFLSVKPTAEQKTTPLTVDMSYEDGAGNAFTSKDIISIPVMQETRLEVDDIVAPPELYAGMQSGLSVQFYNTGKTVLNNLRITAEGDFDTPESTSYFAGNMESGKSDTYDFTFIPKSGGTMEGKIIFTYEDGAGDIQTLERPFSFQVASEMPAMDQGTPPEEAGGGSKKKLYIIVGVVVLLAAAGIFIWKKIRKKKRNREMEINE
jgi:NPCBM-associated, NEW3 domain of alpha-galactosidase.